MKHPTEACQSSFNSVVEMYHPSILGHVMVMVMVFAASLISLHPPPCLALGIHTHSGIPGLVAIDHLHSASFLDIG